MKRATWLDSNMKATWPDRNTQDHLARHLTRATWPDMWYLINHSQSLSLRYNAELANPNTHYLFEKHSKLKEEDKVAVPTSLATQFTNGHRDQGGRPFIRSMGCDNLTRLTKHVLFIQGIIATPLDFELQTPSIPGGRIEQLETTIKTPEVQHLNDSSFILNSASLHAPEAHQRVANLPIDLISPARWHGIRCGDSTIPIK
ncbi:hypothetical protein H4Q26_013696 [Puccinia striiformis f. sp. tritici PST-130]|nr:hypothetical protein H4Q26_013696 [Puccinia striiformis f. sp. tritici PST-130]